jgi:hypothetical protein
MVRFDADHIVAGQIAAVGVLGDVIIYRLGRDFGIEPIDAYKTELEV